MDRVGASIKNEVDYAIAFNPNSVITCASELWEFLPKDNKQISMYSKKDVRRYKVMPPSDLKIACKSFGISSFHEIKFSSLDDNQLSWKKVSADTEYTNASFTKRSSKNTGGKANQVETTNQSQKTDILFIWKRKNPYGIFSIPVFHVLHCIFLNKMLGTVPEDAEKSNCKEGDWVMVLYDEEKYQAEMVKIVSS